MLASDYTLSITTVLRKPFSAGHYPAATSVKSIVGSGYVGIKPRELTVDALLITHLF